MKEIPLTKGYVALVDDADYEWLHQWKWQALINQRPNVTHVYAIRSTKRDGRRRQVMMHREILPPPPGMLIDHINFNGLDNQRTNLRICSPSQNTVRKRLIQNLYGMRGIQYRGGPLPWVGYVMKDGRNRYTAHLPTPEAARDARDALARELYGEFAITHAELKKNLPDQGVGGKSNKSAIGSPCRGAA